MTQQHTLYVCCASRCEKRGSRELAQALEQEIAARHLKATVSLSLCRSGCQGECGSGPLVRIQPQNIAYYQVKPEDAADIVRSLDEKPVKRLLFRKRARTFNHPEQNPFYSKQTPALMQLIGTHPPTGPAAAFREYAGLRFAQTLDGNALQERLAMRSADVGPASVLRCGQTPGKPSPVDELLWESIPHAIIEGIAIAAWALKVPCGEINLNTLPESVRFIGKTALQEAFEQGVLSFEHRNGRFLIRFAVARERKCPPFPSSASPKDEKGAAPFDGGFSSPAPAEDRSSSVLLARPEDFARLAMECLEELADTRKTALPAREGEAFALHATTKIFALFGAVKRTGFVEVPAATPLRDIAIPLGDGIASNFPLKALLWGGESGVFLPERLLDLSFAQLAEQSNRNRTESAFSDESGEVCQTHGAAALRLTLPPAPAPFASSGFPHHLFLPHADSITVFDGTSCLLRHVLFCMRRLRNRSCGSCAACDDAFSRIIALLASLCEGKGSESHLEELASCACTLQSQARCLLCRSAANPLLSALLFFPEEFKAHLDDKRCPAGACRALTCFTIDEATCMGCDLCRSVCPANAIEGTVQEKHRIDLTRCLTCGSCFRVCRCHAVRVSQGH